ncbi:hypothetical protein CCMA1212_006929 [Trichoderma ghanense]|uniref:Uncharacterized protein n=1 Tax=Trichoderma ghanense TaxID=65468 RepID=A0ABY2H0Q3_9HYPO
MGAVCQLDRQPNTGLLANTGECAAPSRHKQGERKQNFHSIQRPRIRTPAGGRATAQRKGLLRLGRGTMPPAQWAAAADRGRRSTAACSTVSVADPGSRRSMDTLLYAVGLSASVQLLPSRLCPIAAAAARCRSLEPFGSWASETCNCWKACTCRTACIRLPPGTSWSGHGMSASQAAPAELECMFPLLHAARRGRSSTERCTGASHKKSRDGAAGAP